MASDTTPTRPGGPDPAQAAMARRRMQEMAARQMLAKRAAAQGMARTGIPGAVSQVTGQGPSARDVAMRGMQQSGIPQAVGQVAGSAPGAPSPRDVAARGLGATGIPAAVQSVAGGAPGGDLSSYLGYTPGQSLYKGPQGPALPMRSGVAGPASQMGMSPGGGSVGSRIASGAYQNAGQPAGAPPNVPPAVQQAAAAKGGPIGAPPAPPAGAPSGPQSVDPSLILAAMRRQQSPRTTVDIGLPTGGAWTIGQPTVARR